MSERCILFDLDGTLVDSVPDLAAALNRLLAARGFAPLDAIAVTAMVGDGAEALVRRGLAARGAAFDAAALTAFMADYTAHAAEQTRLFPDAEQTLRHLAATGWRLAICTNKPEQPARILLDQLGIAGLFAAIGGGDSFAVRKPDPGHLLATLARAGGEPGRAVMVGDHANDVQAAIGAGLPAVFAAWGYGSAAMAEGAARTAASLADLPGIAAALLG
jgi:phosphoglycolate phosphatase